MHKKQAIAGQKGRYERTQQQQQQQKHHDSERNPKGKQNIRQHSMDRPFFVLVPSTDIIFYFNLNRTLKPFSFLLCRIPFLFHVISFSFSLFFFSFTRSMYNRFWKANDTYTIFVTLNRFNENDSLWNGFLMTVFSCNWKYFCYSSRCVLQWLNCRRIIVRWQWKPKSRHIRFYSGKIKWLFHNENCQHFNNWTIFLQLLLPIQFSFKC